MHLEKILILAKTYPVPSAKYEETTCVAGITDNGQMRRLFPIQFRFIDGEKQFKKWQWISARVKKAPKDHRAESHIINSESIVCQDVITTDKFWQARMLKVIFSVILSRINQALKKFHLHFIIDIFFRMIWEMKSSKGTKYLTGKCANYIGD